jgi:BMFP domain-containing protein YqiC
MSPAVVTDTLAEQLMSELAPRLSEAMEKQVAAELRKNLDQTVASLLSQLDVNVREIVRDAVAEKLKQPRDPST